MRNARGLIETIGSWLHFELLCGREELFNERYLSYPIGQFLSNRYGDRLRTEYPHSVLSQGRQRRGDKPRVDFAVVDSEDRVEVAVETKWLGSSVRPIASALIPAIVQDILRLEMLASRFDTAAFLVIAGRKQDFRRLFESRQFMGHADYSQSRELLPTEDNNQRVLRIHPPPAYRQRLFERAWAPFLGMPLPSGAVLMRTAPFPDVVTSRQYVVYGWRVTPLRDRQVFVPELSGQ
jgi:hypothetical protein